MPELLLPRLKREIEARLAELRPLVAEVAHLEAAKRALLEDAAPKPSRHVAAVRGAVASAPTRWTRRACARRLVARAAAPSSAAGQPAACRRVALGRHVGAAERASSSARRSQRRRRRQRGGAPRPTAT